MLSISALLYFKIPILIILCHLFEPMSVVNVVASGHMCALKHIKIITEHYAHTNFIIQLTFQVRQYSLLVNVDVC